MHDLYDKVDEFIAILKEKAKVKIGEVFGKAAEITSSLADWLRSHSGAVATPLKMPGTGIREKAKEDLAELESKYTDAVADDAAALPSGNRIRSLIQLVKSIVDQLDSILSA